MLLVPTTLDARNPVSRSQALFQIITRPFGSRTKVGTTRCSISLTAKVRPALGSRFCKAVVWGTDVVLLNCAEQPGTEIIDAVQLFRCRILKLDAS